MPDANRRDKSGTAHAEMHIFLRRKHEQNILKKVLFRVEPHKSTTSLYRRSQIVASFAGGVINNTFGVIFTPLLKDLVRLFSSRYPCLTHSLQHTTVTESVIMGQRKGSEFVVT